MAGSSIHRSGARPGRQGEGILDRLSPPTTRLNWLAKKRLDLRTGRTGLEMRISDPARKRRCSITENSAMSVSFTKKTVAEVLVLMTGAVIAAAGKKQDSPGLLGLGVIVIGLGVIWGGIGAIRRRRLVFLHGEARFMTHRFTGGAAVLWGVLLSLTGLVLVMGGVGLALGQQAELKAFVMQPGAWLIAGGVALFFVSAAVLWQKAIDGEHGGLRILLALPGYLFAAVGVLLGVGFAGAGVWGLHDPDGLTTLGNGLQSAAQDWLDTL
jgi:hypothetical protein